MNKAAHVTAHCAVRCLTQCISYPPATVSAQGVHNSQSDTAEEIRLPSASVPASEKMPSIAELRHTSDEQQHQLGPPLAKADHDSAALPADDIAKLNTAGLNTMDTSSSQQQQQPEAHSVPLPVEQDAAEGEPGKLSISINSISSSSDSSDSSNTVGVGSISSGISSSGAGNGDAGAGGILEPQSRADDGSEDELLPGTQEPAASTDYPG